MARAVCQTPAGPADRRGHRTPPADLVRARRQRSSAGHHRLRRSIPPRPCSRAIPTSSPCGFCALPQAGRSPHRAGSPSCAAGESSRCRALPARPLRAHLPRAGPSRSLPAAASMRPGTSPSPQRGMRPGGCWPSATTPSANLAMTTWPTTCHRAARRRTRSPRSRRCPRQPDFAGTITRSRARSRFPVT